MSAESKDGNYDCTLKTITHAVNMAQSISATLSTNLEFWVIIHKNCDNANIRNISVHSITNAIAYKYKIMTVRQISKFI